MPEAVRLRIPQSQQIILRPRDNIQVSFGLDSYIPMRPVDIEEYEGEYIVIPAVTEQTLLTEDKYLTQNVVVEEIPTYQTSNPAGGITYIIGN